MPCPRRSFKNKILVGGTLNNARVFRIEPPSVIRYDEIDRVINTLDRVLGEVEQEFLGQFLVSENLAFGWQSRSQRFKSGQSRQTAGLCRTMISQTAVVIGAIRRSLSLDSPALRMAEVSLGMTA